SVREGVVRDELESVAGALFSLNLQRVVFVVGVVAEIPSVNSAATRSWMHNALSVCEGRSRIGERRNAIQEILAAIVKRHGSLERLRAFESGAIGVRPADP